MVVEASGARSSRTAPFWMFLNEEEHREKVVITA
jgi:hypothetical protein